MSRRIHVLGCGVAGPPVVVPDTVALVVGARRHLAAVPLPSYADTVELGPLAPALDRIAAAPGDVAVLASGDPGFFGIVRVLAERFGPQALTVAPAVSSVAAAFARMGLPWDDAVVVSAHGRALRVAVNACLAHPKVAVLTGPGAGPVELAEALRGSGRTLTALEDLGAPTERVWSVDVDDAVPGSSAASVGTVVVVTDGSGRGGLVGPVRTVAGPPPGPPGWALPEDAFAHRDAMVTKAEVRALVLARLGPRFGEMVWDVGAGSGSVAVECARFGAAVVAVERDTADLVACNAAAHGVAVRVVRGEAPAVLHGLPDPDAVFVGGGGPVVVDACAARRPARIVTALAALERVPAVQRALTAGGYAVDGTLLQAARLSPLPGDTHRLAATNPVFVVWGVRR